MTKNIIQLLKSGNQELFYSSFIAWLLDRTGEHGLNERFSHWFFEKIEEEKQGFEIQTEKRLKSGRADIFIKTEGGRRIIIENKTKSIGSNEQIEAYEGDADRVVPLGFVKENFPAELREKVVTYKDVLGFLSKAKRDPQPLAILVEHFISYLDSALWPFETFDKFCKDGIDLEQARTELSSRQLPLENDNDRRFFQAVYFERLQSFISASHPKLNLGTSWYYDKKLHAEKPHATKWIIEKNVQGPSYMEAIVYSMEIPGKMSVLGEWGRFLSESKNPDLSPRLELWIGPTNCFTQDNVGVFQIGCFDEGLRKVFNSSKKFRVRGRRNFHQRPLQVQDLKYQNMAMIMIEEMSKVWKFSNDA
jgi:hypothetical protein